MRRIGPSDDNLTTLQKAGALAEELGYDKKKMHLQSLLGMHYLMAEGDPHLAWKCFESCAEHFDMIQDVELLAPVGSDLCGSCVVSGYYERVTRIAPTIIRLIEGSKTQAELFGKSYNPYSQALGYLGLSMAVSGDLREGEHLCKRALSFELETDHRATAGFVEYVYGALLAQKGDGTDATEHLQNATKYLEESQTSVFLSQTWAWLGYAHCLLGDYETAIDLTEKGLRMHVDAGIGFWRSKCHWLCSFAHYEQGDRQKARTHAEEALHFSLEVVAKPTFGSNSLILRLK